MRELPPTLGTCSRWALIRCNSHWIALAAGLAWMGSVGCSPRANPAPKVPADPAIFNLEAIAPDDPPLEDIARPKFLTAELKFDSPHEQQLADQRSDHRKKMAAIEEECLPALAKLGRKVSLGESYFQLPYQMRSDAVAFSPVAPILAISTSRGLDVNDKVVEIWDLKAGKTIHELQQSVWIDRVAFSPDGRYLMVVLLMGGPINVWNVADGTLKDSFTPSDWGVRGIGFADGGKTVRVIPNWFDSKGSLRLLDWDIEKRERGKETTFVRDASYLPGSFVFTEDGAKMAGVFHTDPKMGEEGRVLVMRASDGALLLEKPLRNEEASLAFSPDGWRLAIGLRTRRSRTHGWERIRVAEWDLRSNELRQLMDIEYINNEHVPRPFYSPDGAVLYFGNPLRVCRVEDGKVIRSIPIDVCIPPGGISPGGRFSTNGYHLFDPLKMALLP